MLKISPFLWYNQEAEEAARFYVSLFPNARIDHVSAMASDSPGGPPGSVRVVEFTLAGQSFLAMTAPRRDAFNDTISLYIDCEDQAEVDHYWDAIEANGGEPQACGWIKDRWGVRWQIVPRFLTESLHDPDRARSKRVSDAMMRMVKIDVAKLREAAEG